MNEKKKNTQARVTIQGNLTGQVEKDGSEHQVYRYHVNIDSPDTTSHQEYDREIHIFKSVPATNNIESPANKEVFLEKNPEPEKHEVTTNRQHNQNLTEKILKFSYTTKIMNLVSNFTSSLRSSLFRAPLLSNLRKPTFPALSSFVPKIKSPSLPGHFLKLNKLTLSFRPGNAHEKSVKKSQKRFNFSFIKKSILFKKTSFSRKGFIQLCIPCILLSAGLLATYLYTEKYRREKIIYPISETQTPAIINRSDNYQAVIEKTGQGVVITLQGPDHEEVLTKLPPGYDPIVEGNKIVHIVTPGNTLWFIAMRYIKNPYRYPDLARLNNIKNPDLIYPGEKVIIQYIRKP